MHRYEVGEHSSVGHLNHFNSLFTGWGSHVYDVVMVRFATPSHHSRLPTTSRSSGIENNRRTENDRPLSPGSACNSTILGRRGNQ
jgi:hypothetical protein